MRTDNADPDMEPERSEELETRSQFGIAFVSSAGFYALLTFVFFFFLRDRWEAWTFKTQLIWVCTILGVNYSVALVGTWKKNAWFGTIFFFFGTLLFGWSLKLLCTVPTDCQTPDGSWGIIDANISVVGYWALGTFALAFMSKSRLLHGAAVLATLLWLTSPSKIVLPVTLGYYALGEYWAWRRNSSVIFYMYDVSALFLFGLAPFLIPDIRVGMAGLVPLCVSLSGVLYWSGVNFKQPSLRAIALSVAAVALGAGSCDSYWIKYIPLSDGLSESVRDLTSYWLSNVFSLIFVIFCGLLILKGVECSSPRLIFGSVALVLWVVLLPRFAGSERFQSALIIIAVFAILFVSLELYISRFRKRHGNFVPTRAKTTDTDALSDDAEFDDLLDDEARKYRNAPHVLAVSEWLEELWNKFIIRLGILPLAVVVLLQFVLILHVAKIL